MAATTTLVRAETPDDLPTGDAYAYHVVPCEDAQGVLDDGLDPARSPDTWNSFDRLLERVAARENIASKPANRADCTFAYTRREQGTDPTVHLSGYVSLVIDLTAVPAPLYAASYGAATGAHMDIVDWVPGWNSEVGPEPDVLPDTVYDSLRNYWDSLVEYDPETGGREDSTELLIDGNVPATAFTHVLDPNDYLDAE